VLPEPLGRHPVAAVELSAVAAADRTVIVLGASNVSRGLARLAATVRARAAAPADVFVAAGHGRAYAVNSRVWMRRLPSILGSGLWTGLAGRAGGHRPVALVTDIGNELLYGLGVAGVAGAVRESVRRLADLGATIAITGLPLASIARVGRLRYRLMRAAYVPGCQLGLGELVEAARWLDEEIRAVSAETGADFIEQPGEWYGLDAIHLKRPRLDDLWSAAFDAWGWPRPAVPPRASFAEWATLASRGAEVRSLARVRLVTPQPAYRGPAAVRIWLY
jgi:hypothetical protein